MALATQCPHCQTTFRVANDQLKLRGGLVRCGSCREVFNGIEHLVRPDVAAPVATPAAVPEQEISSAQTHAVAADKAARTEPQHGESQPAAAHAVHIAPQPFSEQQPEQLPPRLPAAEAAAMVATDRPLPATSISAAVIINAAETKTSASDRVEAAIDGLEEDLRIAEETSQSAPADVHHTPFGLIKPSAPIDPDQPTSSSPAPNVWHRHVDDSDDEDNQMARMTLMHVAGQDDYPLTAKTDAKDGAAHADDDELDRIIDELQRKPWRGEKNTAAAASLSAADGSENGSKRKSREKTAEPELDASDEPDFVLSARRRQRLGGPLRGAMWGIGALLLIGLLAQSTYFFRDQLAARMPQLKPTLISACAKIGCTVGLPMKIDSISIESNELQALDPARNLYSLNLLLRNRSDTVQAWPNIELTLNDANEKAIVRRVFAPHDYLNASLSPAQGFGSDQEQPVKLGFELLQLKASGYRVYLYYP
ncbi:MJ0042 family finger-like domain-containing protein [Collimonas sp. OK242]|uniref:DUF3426 domain-containing protein n=1 Tax=Collimonas sp. OK242 TaxID=1798195 RepID=UPI00089AD7E1|nr:DUF3426 domain-containing protein [Collimonas sp. OK242]SDX51736.1 MJ0042 family finger-like domain-containing protein [Collimonas sp. OK242]